MSTYDVIVVGAGNAALAAAVSAKENGAERVVVIEKAPREMRGGNTHWSGGVLRFAFDDPREIGELLPDVEERVREFLRRHLALSEGRFPRRPDARHQRPHRSGAVETAGVTIRSTP